MGDQIFSFLNAYSIFALAVISPGPDFAVTVRTSITSGRGSGIKCAAGVSIAKGIHILLVHFGLGAVVAQNPLLSKWLLILCAGFLSYLGIQSIISSRTKKSETPRALQLEKKNASPFVEGFFVNIFNTKAVAFWISYFTLIFKTSLVGWIQIIFPVLLVLSLFAWFSFVAVTFTTERVRISFLRYESTFNLIMGILLVLLSVQIVAQNLIN